MWFRTSWILLVVAHFSVLAASKSASAAYEKIWLYYAYQIAYKLDGPNQRYILRQLDPKDRLDRKYTTAINNGNRGSLKDGMMTWTEFQWSLNNLRGQPSLPELEDDLDKTAANIWNSDIRNKLMVNIAASHYEGEDAGVKYHSYIDSLGAMIRRARSEIGDSAIGEEMLRKTREVSEKIVDMRAAEFRQDRYIGEFLRTNFPGIRAYTYQVSDISKQTSPAPVVHGIRRRIKKEVYDVVDLGRTLYAFESEIAIKLAFGMDGDTTGAWRKRFVDFFNNYVKEAFSNGPPIPERDPLAEGHRTVLTVWEQCLEAADNPVCK
ncbi:hypothetical protein CMUS01_06100 [Colletotrichum musicola]|uniref:Uncharacterized protein n=1 Tax=Colletotrichum musicola TaxID=2175873 RepID=A0A8H6KNT7_9PEZI|nr:hypothetical protein CMUS01_06100 [Colletotrichum musicola]